MTGLTMICPSRGRPDNALALMNLWSDVTESAELLVVVDADDPVASRYDNLPRDEMRDVMVLGAPGGGSLGGLGPVLNVAARLVIRGGAEHVGFLGDDHRPRTCGWDRLLVDALGGRPGVAYGDDLIQHDALPTACVIDARLIEALGYMCPPGLVHLFLDDFWKRLGQDVGNLAYHPGAVIEHVHPGGGKAEWDDLYRQRNSTERYNADQAAYIRFIAEQWPLDLVRLREVLGGVEAV